MQKIKIAAFVRLRDALREERAVAALVNDFWLLPGGAALGELGVADFEFKLARGDIELDHVAVAHEGERAADKRFRRHMQHAGAVRSAAHAGVRDTHHVAHAFLEQLFRDRQLAPLRHAGAAERAAVLQYKHAGLVDVERITVDARIHIVIVLEHHRAAGVLHQPRFGSSRLDHRAVGCEIAAQHGKPAAFRQRVVARADDIAVIDLGVLQVLAERFTVDGQAIEIQKVAQFAEQRAQPTGVVEIFHQIFVAGRPHIGQYRRFLRQLVKAVERQLHVGAPRHRNQVNQRIGRARQRMDRSDRIVERLCVENIARLQILPHHFHDAPA